jgi:FAD/FMN-containing dehydrogenase
VQFVPAVVHNSRVPSSRRRLTLTTMGGGSMKRRDFCRMSVAAGTAALLPAGRLLAASGNSPQVADLRAVKLSGGETTIERAAVADLRASLNGMLLTPMDEGYEAARHVWNGMIDRRPALIARCASTADVVRSVTFARERELLLAVRGGGHSFPGYSTCDGGLVIDLSPMHTVEVLADGRSVRAAGGAWGAHVDAAAQKHSLATTLGQISNTGIAGLTLGGGFGWLSRRFGLACDNLVTVELVTADGKVRRVSEHDEPDLFWALRGGGGNFGVATSFEYRLHPLNPTVVAGHVDFPADQVKDAIEFYAGLITRAPRELSVDLSLAANADGKPGAQIFVVYSGDADSASKVLEPLQHFGKPIKNTIGQQSYVVVQTWFDTPPVDPTHWYLKGGFVSEYSSELIRFLAEDFRPDAKTSMYFQSANGAVADVPQTATAFSHRNAIANMMLFGLWKDPSLDEPGRKEIHALWSKLAPFTDGYYVNLHDSDPKDKGTERNYGPNFSRLARLKKQYDPLNLFRLNANISSA